MTHYLYINERELFPGLDSRSTNRRIMRYLMDVAGGETAWCTKMGIRDAVLLLATRL